MYTANIQHAMELIKDTYGDDVRVVATANTTGIHLSAGVGGYLAKVNA